jgi:serpin B
MNTTRLATKVISTFALGAQLLGAAACGDGSNINDADDIVRSVKPRALSVPPLLDSKQLYADSQSKFATAMHGQVRAMSGNLVYSPFSMTSALAMLYAGAKGTTATEMKSALSFQLDGAPLYSAFNWTDQELASRGKGAKSADGQAFRLNVVNDIWSQADYAFDPMYLDTLAENFGTGVHVQDFKRDPEGSRQTINGYVQKATESRIKDLIPEKIIDNQTRLVLTNAVYMNAHWKVPFEPKVTSDAPFTKLDAQKADVKMMHQETFFSASVGNGYSAVDLPYEDDNLSMLLVIPDEGTFGPFEAGFDAAKLQAVRTGMKVERVKLAMPRFEFPSTIPAAEIMKKLGMVAAFGTGADLSGISTSEPLKVQSILHKAFIKVQENGTEAAAATAVVIGVGATAPIENTLKISADRPFLFVIADKPTGTVLFMGRVLDPNAN